ncbi:decaprenyl-phosphate phosphoribosyltransferase [soil metagenome]
MDTSGTIPIPGSPAVTETGALTATTAVPRPAPSGLRAWLRLLRIHQWSKGAFVFVGPVYGQALLGWQQWLSVTAAFLAFGAASSGCYIVNDFMDREADRAHPRKRTRPLAAGTIAVSTALAVAALCLLLGLALPWVAMLLGGQTSGPRSEFLGSALTSGCVALYIGNTMAYSIRVKHVVISDVMSLSLGFVLRVLGGCAVVMVEPSTWLLNVTLFLAMFLAFGKRLGERRAMGDARAASARVVQAEYTGELLRMVVVVTAVACLVTYAVYVASAPARLTVGFNLLWLTMMPATYGLLRAIHLLEKGTYDDPTELAVKDRPFQFAAALFGLITLVVMWVGHSGALKV